MDERTDDALSTVNGIESNNLLVANVKNENDERLVVFVETLTDTDCLSL